MARKIHRLKDAKVFLDIIHKDLVASIQSGFGDWLKIREHVNTFEGGPVNYKPRTKAGIIHDHIEKYVRTTFEGKEGILVGDFKGVLCMLISIKTSYRIFLIHLFKPYK